ncbi:MAG: aerial mycelium formation protein [Actinobacteria bacterium]|nr:aerial mycelium formation protein [Actinomycetota bacterium]
MAETSGNGKRRIDRILRPGFSESLGDVDLDELRFRRDECMAEREYLSLLRRMVQGRADILQAEADRRRSGEEASEAGAMVGRLPGILADRRPGPGRGEAIRMGGADEEVAMARRRVERLVADAAISNPGTLTDDDLDGALENLRAEEREVSAVRAKVIVVLDRLQDELKRRYREDPSTVGTP